MNPQREGFIGGGCHAVDLLRWIAGNPTEVTAYSNHKYLTDWPVDDTTIAIMKFPTDVIGKVFCSIGIHRPYTMRTVINGTNGTLIFDAKDETMTLYAGDRATGKGYSKKQVIPAHATDAHNMAGEVADFLNALINGTPMPIPALEGASTVAVCRAAVESAHSGMPQKVKYPEI
ncbi:MAG: Gfo/Idh/MocA family oxidoreductase [Oscillospiraceae bacterium]|nr:Gfo/Idh/MocA family oxidoreductase [Oscillospiraceae bacterium]